MTKTSKAFEIWPVIVTGIFLFFISGCFIMTWIAVRNPPELIKVVDEWK